MHKIKFLIKKTRENKLSIRLLIIISFVIILILTCGIIMGFTFISWKNSINNYVKEIEEQIDSDVDKEINNLVQIPLMNNNKYYYLIKYGIIDMNNQKEIDSFFAGIVKESSEEVYSVSYGMENGDYYGARRNNTNEIELYNSTEDTDGHSLYYSVYEDLTRRFFLTDAGLFDPRVREWYMSAKEVGHPLFSPIYKHFVKNDLAITAAYPIYNENGELQGVLGTHITLTRLNTVLENIMKDRQGTAYIVEMNSGNLVANSNGISNFITSPDGTVNRITLDKVVDQHVINAMDKYKQTGLNRFTGKQKNEKMHIKFSVYKESGIEWLIITSIPDSIFVKDIKNNYQIALLLLALFILVSILIYTRITNILLNPVKELIRVTDLFSVGDLSQRALITRKDEIGKLSLSFNHMADELYKYINHLEDLVRERTTEIEKMNLELMKSNEDKQMILDSTAEGIFGLDLEDKCTFMNVSGLRILGYDDKECLVGQRLHWSIHHKHADGTQYSLEECKLYNAMRSGKPLHEDKEVFWSFNGNPFPVEYYVYPQYRQGNLTGAVITFMDITERLDYQNALIAAKEQAEAANIAKTQFLANMSHEIRTPMNGILGFLQILEYTQLDNDQKEFIQMIKTSTDSLLSVINDILDISKIEAGLMKLENIPFEVRSLVEGVATLFYAKASEKDLELNMLISTAIPGILLGDPTRLRQVLVNLISNAIKFTDKGSIYIEVTLKDESEEAVEVLFRVKDTGIGISQNDLNKLFSPFTQVDSSITRKYGGTGLGLAICKKLIEQMNGKINVNSIEGKGSVFDFTVSFHKNGDLITQVKIDYEIFQDKFLLIVDENAMNRDIIREYLEELGCMVQEATTVEEAIIKLYEDQKLHKLCIILLDYKFSNEITNFPNIIKLLNPTQEYAQVLIAPISSNQEINKLKRNGFSGVITKPFKRNEIIHTLSKVIKEQAVDMVEPTTNTKSNIDMDLTNSSDVKLLLAEDNEVNQKFIINLLKMHGITCDVVCNGEEAVKAYLNKAYDIILMDCQMPILDGFEATRKIRELANDHRHVKIIALTAYAMKGDKEKCIDAGMDAYLNKPIDTTQLLTLLNTYSKSILRSEHKEEDNDFYEKVLNALMNESGFDRIISMELLNGFYQSANDLLNKIQQSLEEDMQSTSIYVHQLKGLAANLRVKEIAEYALNIESIMKSKSNTEYIQVLLTKIQLIIDKLRMS